MRASTDQVRDLTHDVVDGARRRASGAVSHGADRVVTTLDGAASTIGDGVDRLAERTPTLTLAAQRPKRRHRVRTLVIASLVLVVILAVARKLLGDEPRQFSAQPAPTPSPGDDTEPAATNGNGNNSKTDDPDSAEPLEEANVGNG